jgi:hypothetical protein
VGRYGIGVVVLVVSIARGPVDVVGHGLSIEAGTPQGVVVPVACSGPALSETWAKST